MTSDTHGPASDVAAPAPAAAPSTTAGVGAGKKQPSISLTPNARAQIDKLQAKREAEGKARATGLRIGIRGGGCTGFGYLFEWCDDAPRATDRIFEFDEGRVRVIVDPKSLLFLDGLVLDYVTGMMGHGFKFENPNVKGSCGCGESVQF